MSLRNKELRGFVALWAVLLLVVPDAFAQRFASRPSRAVADKSRYFVDVSAGMGYHSMNLSLRGGGDKNGRVGATAGAYFRYVLRPDVHLFSGLGATLFSARSQYDNLETTTTATDPQNGQQYTFRAQFSNWQEVQREINLEVPAGAFYVHSFLRTAWVWMLGGGVRLDLPLMKRFRTDNGGSGSMTRTAYFPSTNVDYEDIEDHGLYSSSSFAGKADTRAAGLSLFFDGGFSRPLWGKKSIYLGAYFSHSLLSLSKGGGAQLYDPASGSYSGVVSSNLVGRAHLMAVGVRAAFSFGF